MRKIIIIGGDLAAGKSTFSRYLAQRFQLSLINKDILKEILGDHIETKNRAENKNLSVISFALIKYLLKTIKGNIIIESNFKTYEMDELKEMLKEEKVLSLKLVGNDQVLHQRFNERLKTNRHHVHRSQDFTRLEDFQSVLNELRDVNYIGQVINVNVDDAWAEEQEDILQQIQAFLSKTV